MNPTEITRGLSDAREVLQTLDRQDPEKAFAHKEYHHAAFVLLDICEALADRVAVLEARAGDFMAGVEPLEVVH